MAIEVVCWSEDNDVTEAGQLTGLILRHVPYDETDEFISAVVDAIVGEGISEGQAVNRAKAMLADIVFDPRHKAEIVTSYKPGPDVWKFPESADAQRRVVGTRMRLVIGYNQVLEGYLVIRDLGEE